MTLRRAAAPSVYGQDEENAFREAVDEADARNQKTDEDVVITAARRLVLIDRIDGSQHSLTLRAGVLVLEPL